MESPCLQTALIQRKQSSPTADSLPLAISTTRSIPDLPTPYHVRIRVHAVGINPTDYKMITHYYMEDNPTGCDFAGVIDMAGEKVSGSFSPGTRVCGAEFPYRPNNQLCGAFQQWTVADSRQLLRLPESWGFTEAAALGAIGWGTACLALWGSDTLSLKGFPSRPTTDPLPVLVYGGATATGLIATQILRLSGYLPIVVCSAASSSLCISFGAFSTASYTDEGCAEQIKLLSGKCPLKHALDCITDAQSTATCFASLSRVGGRYACLEDCPEVWRTRKAVKVGVVMGFELQGIDVELGNSTYSRKANQRLFQAGIEWAREIQTILDAGRISTQSTQEVYGGFEGIIDALEKIRRGGVKGRKLVVKLQENQ